MSSSAKTKEPVSWLKILIAVIAVFFASVFLYAFHDLRRYAHQAACTSMHKGMDIQDGVQWDIRGNKTIESITITMTRTISDAHYNPTVSDSAIALSMAGKYIQDIASSKAVHTSFTSEDADDSHRVIVTIEIDPSKLSSPDYEYLNANGFIRIGTVDYSRDTVQELSTVLEADGYTCTCK